MSDSRQNAARVFARLVASQTPLVRGWYHRRRFKRDPGISGLKFFGVYSSFDEARKHVPPGFKEGHECANWAKRYLDDIGATQLYDYPVLFWIERLLQEGPFVFDFGGNLGTTFYAYHRLGNFPASLGWTVCERPEVVQAGRELAAKNRATQLHFTTDRALPEGCDIFYTGGTLQYLEEPLSSIFVDLKRKPRHVIINRLPLHEGRSFVTLQNLGTLCAYKISNRRQFIDSVLEQGYRLIDSWSLHRACEIPLHPDIAVRAYDGMYFRAVE